MFDNFGALDSSIQQKIDADVDFQTTLADLSDEDKENAIKEKKTELFDQEIASLSKKAQEAEKAQELANNYKGRSERTEAELKELKKTKPESKSDDLSQKDLLHLVKAEVHEDDIDRVVKFAKLENISIADALKT